MNCQLQIDKEWIALNDQKMKIFELTKRDTLVLKKWRKLMELTKEEMKFVKMA